MTVDLTRCSGCERRISAEDVKKNKVVSLLNRMWHQEHLCCVVCKLLIADGRVFQSVQNEDDIVCYSCHIETSNPACSGCGYATFDRAVFALGRPYHVDCLRCVGCFRTIPHNAGFYVRDTQIYDDACFILNAKENP